MVLFALVSTGFCGLLTWFRLRNEAVKQLFEVTSPNNPSLLRVGEGTAAVFLLIA